MGQNIHQECHLLLLLGHVNNVGIHTPVNEQLLGHFLRDLFSAVFYRQQQYYYPKGQENMDLTNL